MHLTLTITNPESPASDNDIVMIEVVPEMLISTLRATIQADTQIPPTSQHLYHNGNLISADQDEKTIADLGIADYDMLAVHVRDMTGTSGVPAQGGSSQARNTQPSGGPGSNSNQDAEAIRLRLLSDPKLRQQVEQQHPQMIAAINNPPRFAELYRENLMRDQREREERQRMIARLNEDPFDPEAQARIEEIIRQERVTENLQNALEHNPEVFGRVHMLYVEVEVNGHMVKALVDSGAQATIMSPAIAEACGIMRLVDKRYAGVAKGVGTANIIGRVHSAPIRIGTAHLACSFTVMEGKSVDMLLGLDMLKRHQATLDLSRDKLVIQGVEVSFLGEADIPQDKEEALVQEPTVPGPAGTSIGARSGAVIGAEESSKQQQQQQQQQQQGDAAAGSSASGSAAPTAASGNPSPGAPALRPANRNFPEQSIELLSNMAGVPRQAAIDALTATGGNVDAAAALLLGV